MKKLFPLLFVLVLLSLPMLARAQAPEPAPAKTAAGSTVSYVDTAKKWIDTQLNTLEAYRSEQALSFSWKRYYAKQHLGITGVARDGTPQLPPEVPPATEKVPYPSTTPDLQSKPSDYVTLIYSTILSSFFGTKPLFYIILVVVALFLLRQLFRWLF